MTSKEVREQFLKYFEQHGHTVVKSDSLIPSGDPTLLFTSAGMVQFKDQFLGKVNKGYTRAASCQKCFRTSDIDHVGNTIRHLTFFEMLGNFSFGDYFKPAAIPWSWEFLTKRMNLPSDKLYVSIFKNDDEAKSLWLKIIPENRIVKLGEETNYWTMGPTGPCGPCSEIIFDRGEKYGCGRLTCNPGCDCDRWLEVWNLVFTQFDRQPDGTSLPLPKKNIDTGMGLERLTMLVQGVDSCFMTDLFKPFMQKTVALLNIDIPDIDIKELRIIADHVRGIVILCSDGVVPSNEGRGYVLRRILRRAVRQGKILISTQKTEMKPFLYKLSGEVVELMKSIYSDLETQREHIANIIKMEEEKFLETLDTGTQLIEAMISDSKKKGNILLGEDVFKLYDTYGFPPDLTSEIAKEHSVSIDWKKFEQLQEQAREISRQAWKGSGKQELGVYKNLYTKLGDTKFVGYEKYDTITEIIGIIVKGESVETASEGQQVEVILKETPFYAEQGGQVGDTGEIIAEDGYGSKKILILIEDTQKIVEGLVVHKGKVRQGGIKIGESVFAKVDIERRFDIQRNHTSTHLLHKALHEVLGKHAVQSGSLVSPERLRFDFTHPKALSNIELERIEELVNISVLRNFSVNISQTSLENAKKTGAIALFGEKYGDVVRTVTVSEKSKEIYSMELCGGTHCTFTGEIGLFKIISESSVAAGTRRIEAITGRKAYEYVTNIERNQNKIAELLRTAPAETITKLNKLLEEKKRFEKKVADLELKLATAKTNTGKQVRVETINGLKVVLDVLDNISAKALADYADKLKNEHKSGIIIVGSVYQGKPYLIVSVTNDIIEKGYNAGAIIKELAKDIGGSGGGRKEFAQAGGKNIDGLKTAVEKSLEVIRTLAP